jgi:hypothetical protein
MSSPEVLFPSSRLKKLESSKRTSIPTQLQPPVGSTERTGWERREIRDRLTPTFQRIKRTKGKT